jgi:hypothetical protein
MAHNTYEAARTMPKVRDDIGKAFSKGNGKDKLFLLVVLLVLSALCAGGLTTAVNSHKSLREIADPNEDGLRHPVAWELFPS